MCAEFTPRVFANLAIGNADDLVFGVAPHPVRCGLGLEIGSGKVYPEVNFTLPTMELTETLLAAGPRPLRGNRTASRGPSGTSEGSRSRARVRALAAYDRKTEVGRGTYADS